MAKAKVLIVTHPLGGNYGGILQAYALQHYVSQLGFDVQTTSVRRLGRLRSAARYGYHRVKRIVHAVHPTPATLTPDIQLFRNQLTREFIDAHIHLISGSVVRRSRGGGDWRALIVGSDQVWRKAYTPVQNNLLDFAKNWDVRRISYAASFGRDDLSEYSPELLAESARLAQKFDAISVREKSGVELVRRYWGRHAEVHVDPTMLFDGVHYIHLGRRDTDGGPAPKGCLFAYVLDREEGHGRVVQRIVDGLGLEEYDLLPPPVTSRKEFFADMERFQLPPVSDWLQAFENAGFVVTDSFHGTVFSLIYKRPFLVVGNHMRGLTRIHSLLELFGLEDRLVEDESQVTDELLHSEIDWAQVETILQNQRDRSRDYLTKHLGNLN